jgi:hypothetical protein
VITKEMNNPTILSRPDLMAPSYRELLSKLLEQKPGVWLHMVRKVVDHFALHMSGLGVQ